jgi:hypothetical protein
VYSDRRKGGDTMIRKDLIIAILATFCLTATLFLIIPTRSQTVGNYDPWLDTNGDGKIDGKDLGAAAYAFGSGGDPTRNVNVTNWPTESPYRFQTFILNCTFTNSDSQMYFYFGWLETPIVYVGGYSRMWVCLIPPNATDTTQYAVANYSVTHEVYMVDWIDDVASSFAVSENFFTNTPTNATVNVYRSLSPHLDFYYARISDSPIQIKLPYVRLHIYSTTRSLCGDEPGWMIMTLKIYLRNE